MVRTKCDVWSRVVGYLRPISRWNEGKVEEFKNREMFEFDVSKEPNVSSGEKGKIN